MFWSCSRIFEVIEFKYIKVSFNLLKALFITIMYYSRNEYYATVYGIVAL